MPIIHRRKLFWQPKSVHDPVAGAYSGQAQQFFDRVSDPGGTRKGHYATMIDALVSAGVWAKLDTLYLFAAADQATALTSLIVSTYNATAVNSPTFTADQGFTGASTKYVDSSFNPTTAVSPKFIQDDASLFAWSLKVAQDAGGLVGQPSGTSKNYIYARYTDDNSYIKVNGGTNSVANTDGSGLFAASRVASNSTISYRNGSSTATYSTSSGVSDNVSLAFLQDLGGYFTGTVTAGGFGSKLDATEHLALYNALHVYLQAVAGVA